MCAGRLHVITFRASLRRRLDARYDRLVFGDSLNQTELADRIGVEQQTPGRVLRDLGICMSVFAAILANMDGDG